MVQISQRIIDIFNFLNGVLLITFRTVRRVISHGCCVVIFLCGGCAVLPGGEGGI